MNAYGVDTSGYHGSPESRSPVVHAAVRTGTYRRNARGVTRIGLLPTKERMMRELFGKEALDSLQDRQRRGLLQGHDFCIVEGRAGSWRMLPNGATVFHCPPVYDYETKATGED